MQTILFFVFALYITLECFAAFYKMHLGDKLCRLAKYSAACLVGLLGVVFNVQMQSNPVCLIWLIPDTAIALFLWPTTYARLTGQFKNRIGD